MLKLLFLVLVAAAFAQSDCQPYNLITKKDSPFQNIPVYDQGRTGMCYAYATASMVDYHLIAKKKATGTTIHPFWAAYLFSNISLRNSFSMGKMDQSIKHLIEERNCSYDVVERELKKEAVRLNFKPTSIVWLLETFNSMFNQEIMNTVIEKKLNLEAEIPFEYVEAASSKAREEVKNWIKESKLGEPLGAFVDKLRPESNNENSLDIFLKLTRDACSVPNRDPVDLPLPKAVELSPAVSPEKLTSLLKGKLKHHRFPIGVTACWNMADDPSYRGVIKQNKTWAYQEGCRAHVVLIVGQQKIENKCHVLIRNSYVDRENWGKNISHCICRDQKTHAYGDCKLSDDLLGKTIEGCWLGESELLANTGAFTTIE